MSKTKKIANNRTPRKLGVERRFSASADKVEKRFGRMFKRLAKK